MLPEFRVEIHASGILTRDLLSGFMVPDSGRAPGFWPGPRILAGPPDSGWAPGFWPGPRYTAGFPQASRSFSATCAAFPQSSSGFAASQRFFHGLTRQFPQQSPRQYPGSPLSSPPAAPGGIPGSPKFPQQFPWQFPAAPRQFPGGTRRHPGSSKSPRQFPRQFPQHSSRRPPGYLMSWRLTFLSEKEKVLPTPNSLRTVIRSPCASMMCLTMARPSPVPPCSRERPLSVR